jgi:hypothetical protein
MATHVKILGIMHIVFGALGLLAALLILIVFGGIAGLVGSHAAGHDAELAMPVVGGIGALIFLVIAVLSLPGLIAGIGLLHYYPWARVLMIVVSALHLMNIPFGTALGVYGLWALLNRETEALFAQPQLA